MAAGVIRNLSDFRLTASFQHPFYCPLDIQNTLIEDEEEEEEDEEEGYGQEVDTECTEDSRSLLSQVRGGEREWMDESAALVTTENTNRLLRFVDLINSDIQRYFGRKNREEDPDACDIYEDRTFQGKCGRERYYADLVKMAQAGGGRGAAGGVGLEEDQESTPPSLNLLSDSNLLVLQEENTQKLGPLAELFEYGLRTYVGFNGGSKQVLSQKADKRYGHILPMCKRLLPPSFWMEPLPIHPVCALNTSNTPDFSDLLANWTTESAQELQGGVRDSIHELNRQALETDFN